MESLVNSLSSVLPLALPLTFTFFGLRKVLKMLNKEKYEQFSILIQDRLFLKYMDDDLLKDSLFILKREKNKRLKLKINKFLKFNIFKIYD